MGKQREGRKLIDMDVAENSGVDDPAHGVPGWLMLKSAGGDAEAIAELEELLRKASDIEMTLDTLEDALEGATEGLKDAPAEVKIAANVLYAWLRSLPDPDAGDEMDQGSAGGGVGDVDTITKAAGKTVDGKVYPKGDWAYTPSDNPSSWKLRLTAEPGGKPDPGIVGAAAAALGKGFRGNKVEIPEADLPAVKAKVRAAWKAANPDKDDSEMPTALRKDSRPSVMARALAALLGKVAEDDPPEPVAKASETLPTTGEVASLAERIAKAKAITDPAERHTVLTEAVRAFVAARKES